MTTTELYIAASKAKDGVATMALADGATLFCCVGRVAGRSIVRRHHRTEWRHKPATEQYSKRISRARAVELLKQDSQS